MGILIAAKGEQFGVQWNISTGSEIYYYPHTYNLNFPSPVYSIFLNFFHYFL